MVVGIDEVAEVARWAEGWDASTVPHVLGVRAFGAQLLCEQGDDFDIPLFNVIRCNSGSFRKASEPLLVTNIVVTL